MIRRKERNCPTHNKQEQSYALAETYGYTSETRCGSDGIVPHLFFSGIVPLHAVSILYAKYSMAGFGKYPQ